MPESSERRGRLLGRLSPLARRRAAWLLAPALATAAIAFQVGLDVPRAPMLERDQKPPKKPRKSAAARNAQAQAKANKAKAKQAQSKKPPQRRTARALAGLRARWSDVPLEDEPINQNFRRRHDGLLRHVVTRARELELDGAPPPPMQIRPGCRTIRCDLELCGPTKLVAAIAELLPVATLADQPLLHELREVEPIHEPAPDPKNSGPKQRKPNHQVCRRWIVDFTVDGGDPSKLAFPELSELERAADDKALPG
ncbi:hypothetical protein [Enhygromyxa salina]|uniref:Uncharacterized protein n=1 Tax=Enhygromyxa salina TaxID=215803 RepID=A0A2S9YYL5_9BACT|nr:hypothetical protein [Enhygromyxa salina]PRQ10183.1 hypothetical protein ENSA7_01320 [Enhygromyxa salina]